MTNREMGGLRPDVLSTSNLPQAEASFGDIEVLRTAGSTAKLYSDVRDFARVLDAITTEYVLTKTQGLFSLTYTAVFRDAEGTVHSYMAAAPESKDEVKALYDVIKSKGITEIDGTIIFSQKNGDHIIKIYPDNNEEQDLQTSYDHYLGVVSKISKEDSVVRFVEKDGQVVMNFRNGTDPYLTSLDNDSGRTVEETMAKLPGVPYSDETWVTEI